MFRFSTLWRILMILVLVALLAGAGTALYHAGLAQGYQAGVAAAAKTGSGTTPQLPYYGYGYPPFGFYPGIGYPGFFPFFGPLIGIGFFLLIFVLISGVFRFAFRRHWAGRGDWGYGPGPWGQGPHGWGYGPAGKDPSNPQSEKTQGPTQSA
ncbi:MAG TPA: hypothetical protein VKF38_17305 [Anaerolineaceae bacterium]|nr:hypothetical protein [Anaerolineaceae bacterium]